MLSHISTLIAVQKQTGLTVFQKENWLRELTEDLPQLIWAADENGKKTFCSRRYLDYTGAADLQAMDRSWSDFIHSEDRAATVSSWMQAIASGEPYTAEYRLRRSDGAFRYIKAQALPTYGRNGCIDGWLGMSQDINEQRVAEHTREVDAKLFAVRQLASSIAHEINNPLESVTNALFLALQDHTMNVSTRCYLHLADAELHRLAHITTHSLRFHKQASAPARKHLRHIVEDVLLTYRNRLESAGIQIKREFRDDAELFCYADDLSQAITNLIRNSIDATTPGGLLRVRIRCAWSWAASGNRPHVRLTIADNGVGVPREAKGRLFQPFFTTKGPTHTGLALWITDQIIRKHNGTISFRKRRGSDLASSAR